MNVFDDFFKKFAYKFPKGYPDLENEQDIFLLESLLGQILGESFTVFPTTEDEISNAKVKKLFKIIKDYPKLQINDPIAIDPTKPNSVKISRSLQRDKNFIDYISDELDITLDSLNGGKWEGLSVLWGDGSKGGRGIKSKGFGFEDELVVDLELLNTEGITSSNKGDFKYPDLISEMSKELNLTPGTFKVHKEGDKNQSRPLKFNTGGPTIAFSNETAAKTLTDITIETDSEEYYLSAKFGNQLTFFNSGITKILPSNEIKDGEIKNSDGKALLDTFGIDNKTFCRIFNEYPNTNFSDLNGSSSNYDTSKIKNLIKSGIGEGYYMVKAGGKGTEFHKIDSEYAEKASNISGNPKVYYGGLEGQGKRVDIVFESSLYRFKVNIRNKAGGLYPTHIMCDYYKK